MTITAKCAALALAAAVGLSIGGCEKNRDEMRPDMDTVMNERGLQSRDLREMTDKLAPDLLQIPEIANNPNKVVIVMKPIQNKLESDPGRDLTIYVARLKSLLNSRARDKMAFVEDQATLRRVQGEELGGGNPDPFEDASRGNMQMPPDQRVKPQYALWGTFYEQNNGKTSYYLCTFRLTDLKTGVQIWEGPPYEVRTLNAF
jgi:hypothetical protein